MNLKFIIFLTLLMGCREHFFESQRFAVDQGHADEIEAKIDQQQSSTISPLTCNDQEDASIKQKVFSLNFANNAECKFGNGDNLPAQAGIMAARELQQLDIPLPPNSEICQLQLSSRSNNLHYDDYMFLTLNGTVLVASELGWANQLPESNGTRNWDWTKIAGKPHAMVEQDINNYGTPYCLGTKNCVVPKHDSTGAFHYQIDSKLFKSMFSTSEILQFKMIATGDNDMDDCDHSSFKINLTISYL